MILWVGLNSYKRIKKKITVLHTEACIYITARTSSRWPVDLHFRATVDDCTGSSLSAGPGPCRGEHYPCCRGQPEVAIFFKPETAGIDRGVNNSARPVVDLPDPLLNISAIGNNPLQMAN